MANTYEAAVCIDKYTRALSERRTAAYLRKKMNESTSESKKDSKVYEISYILVPSLPAEKVGEQTAALTAILAEHSAVVIDEEAPSLISLAY
jgi:hypothetical protein